VTKPVPTSENKRSLILEPFRRGLRIACQAEQPSSRRSSRGDHRR
jgi:hypothetical protein